MTVQVHTANCQVAGFAIVTIAWIFSSTSMGQVEWRVWHTDGPSFYPSIVCVGMWRFCIYNHDSNFSKTKRCHQYIHHESFLPLDIRVARYLLLVASALGLLGKAFAILALRNVHMGIPQKDTPCRPFVVAAILTIAACGCISVATLWNYSGVLSEEMIPFPPSFHVPLQSSTQRMGSAMLVAALGAILMLLSGTFFLSYSFPPDTQVYPET